VLLTTVVSPGESTVLMADLWAFSFALRNPLRTVGRGVPLDGASWFFPRP
jgi:hypothetical protein